VVSIKITSGEGTPVILNINEKELVNAEGYFLEIKSDSITINAHDQTGLYYGTLTLLQILNSTDELCELTIEDWPSIKMRS